MATVAFAAGLAVAALAAWAWLHGRNWREDDQRGPMGHGTITLAVDEVVNDIRPLNRLVVFRAYVTATTTTHDIGWVSQTDQTMLTPAFVNYYVDLSKIGSEDIRIAGTQIRLRLPPLMIERPNVDTTKVQVFNAGGWSLLTSTADRLRLQNSRMAVRQLREAANMPFLLEAAVRAEVAAVSANVNVALAAAGHRDVAVVIAR